jgi:hypothetical protein
VADREHHTGRNLALAGGVGLLVYLLLRPPRRLAGAAADTSAQPPCRIWVRADRIDLDGVPTDLATVLARCKQRGRAEVHATGDAITRSIVHVLRALRTAGVAIEARPELLRLLALEGP